MIFRIVKRENPYVTIDKRPIEDVTLSWKAKGILAYLLSRPPGWEIVKVDLINRATDGREAVETAMQELRRSGYARLMHFKGGSKWLVAEHPSLWEDKATQDSIDATEGPEVRDTGKPYTGKPYTANPPLVMNEGNKNELTNTGSFALDNSPPSKPSREKTEQQRAKNVVEAAQAEEIYAAFPKQEPNPAHALRMIRNKMKKYTPDQMLVATKAYCLHRKGDDPRFTSSAVNWFREDKFLAFPPFVTNAPLTFESKTPAPKRMSPQERRKLAQ